MKFFSKKELKVLWPFYLDGILMILFILMPFMVIYFNSIGFSATQMGILFAMWPLASLLFEIPTGAIADLYGRKFSVILGVFLTGFFLVLISFFTGYYSIMILLALAGISQTLISGSSDAWVVDLLRAKKMKNFLHSYFAKMESIQSFGVVIAGLLGVFLVARFGLGIIWIASGLSFFLSGIFLIFGEEIHKKKKLHVRDSLKSVWKQSKFSAKYSYKHPVLFYVLIIAFIYSISLTLRGLISWTPLLQSFNFPDYAFGYLWSAIGIIGMFAPLLSKKFLKKNKERNFLIVMSSLLLAYGFLVLFSGTLYLLVLAFLIAIFIGSFRFPVARLYFHKFIPSKIRSTIGSVRGMLIGVSSVIGLSLVGVLVDNIGGRYTIFISALLMIPIILLYLRIKEDSKH